MTASQTAPMMPSISFESFRDLSSRVAMSTVKSTTIKPMRVVRIAATTLCQKPKSVFFTSNVSMYKQARCAATAILKVVLTT